MTGETLEYIYAVYKYQSFKQAAQNLNVSYEIINVKLEVCNLDEGCTVFSVIKPTQTECISAFEDAPIFSGKTFWDVEQEIQWVDD